MKAIYLSPTKTAAETTARYAQAIAGAGINVHIYSRRPDGGEYHKALGGGLVPVRPFGDAWKPWVIPVIRHIRYLKTLPLPALDYLAAVLMTHADIYIAGDPDDLNLASYAARLHRGRLVYAPFEYYPATSYATPLQSKKWQRIEAQRAADVDAWISLGDKLTEEYEGQYSLQGRVHTVYSSCPRDAGKVQPCLRERLQVGAEVRLLLYQGYVREHRGVYDILQALLHLPNNLHFVALGLGELDVLRHRAAALGLSERVHVLEAVPQSELLAYTAGADVGIIASHDVCRSYRLCCPCKLFEYIAAGLPLVVGDLDQLGWFVTKHQIGAVFETGNSASIARAVWKVLGDEDHRRQCANNSRALQETQVCWEIQAEKLRRAVLGTTSRQRQAKKPARLTGKVTSCS